MINKGMFTANRQDWETPDWLFRQWDDKYHFETDVCALPHNAKCPVYYTPETDGLAQKWHGTCWMNPPYGREIATWIKKAYESSLEGATVVCLIPSRTDTAWWHDYVMRASKIHYIRGRIQFVGAPYNAPFPCAVVVFSPSTKASKPTPNEVSKLKSDLAQARENLRVALDTANANAKLFDRMRAERDEAIKRINMGG